MPRELKVKVSPVCKWSKTILSSLFLYYYTRQKKQNKKKKKKKLEDFYEIFFSTYWDLLAYLLLSPYQSSLTFEISCFTMYWYV